jgi:IclR family transcriptional regulator, pca regulon regulatory protein
MMRRVTQPTEGDTFAWSPRGEWFSSSMDRGLAILECFSPARPALRLIDIADELGMKPSSTHRYLSTLVALGYLEQDARHRYRLALAVTRLGLSAMSAGSLREHAHPYLQELSRQTSYATAIAILDGPEILYIDWLPSPHRVQNPIDLPPEARLPAYCTAMGKMLLASLPPDERDTLVAELKLKRHTPNTITSRTKLRAKLNTVAERGIAVNDQEHTPGQHAIAAPVRDQSEVIAAISLAAPASRTTLKEMVDHLTPHLRSTAYRISARLGHRRVDERRGDEDNHTKRPSAKLERAHEMYRLRTVEGLSLREIADIFDVTIERVRQVLRKNFNLAGEPPAAKERRIARRKAKVSNNTDDELPGDLAVGATRSPSTRVVSRSR